MRPLAALVLLAGMLAAQRPEFVPVPQSVIEERLKENRRKPAERLAALEKLFETAGCKSEPQPVKSAKLPNAICTLPGTGDGVILVGAHYDSAGAGEGIVDNWSGAALLPSLYQTLKEKPRSQTFVFIGFTDEEKGLVGSRFYAEKMSEAEKSRTRAMINLDTLGLTFTKLWRSRSDPKLADALERVASAMGLPLQGVNVEQVGSTDSESFAALGIPRITIHSVTPETFGILHSAQDKLSAINPSEYYATYRLLAAYLVYLDQVLATEPPSPPSKN